MLIARGTHFLVTCPHHDGQLVIGELKFKHPNPDATAVWAFDFTSMTCPVGEKGPFVNGCRKFWEVRA